MTCLVAVVFISESSFLNWFVYWLGSPCLRSSSKGGNRRSLQTTNDSKHFRRFTLLPEPLHHYYCWSFFNDKEIPSTILFFTKIDVN